MKIISESIHKLQNYIEQESYRGWDPYDILSSPVFKLSFFNSNKPIRFFAQQLGKRLPINLRPMLLVPKGYNPVTLGLCIQGYSFLYKIETQEKVKWELFKKIEFLINELIELKSNGFSGACWGYDFDWEARNAKIPGYKPNVVSTGIITNALFQCHKITGNVISKELVIDSSKFILNDLNRSLEDKTLCFSYSPFDKQKVLNASMKGVRILSQTYTLTGNKELLEIAERGINYVIREQNPDGSWGYSDKKKKRVDSYHTGYILDCLDEYIKLIGDNKYKPQLFLGIGYFVKNLIENNSIPKFYNDNKSPLDCTSAAQIILSLTRFGYLDIATNIAEFMSQNMQDNEGYFYFRKFKFYNIKTSFMRWSNAWMYAALSYLLSNK
jgi:hypothetical protein